MVVIKDMEMPKYCNDCDFGADSLGYCERANEHIPNYDFFSDTNEKPNFCPLVEIEESKTGHWIVTMDCEGKNRKCTCDKCGYETGKYTWHNPNYCPNCGCRMESEE